MLRQRPFRSLREKNRLGSAAFNRFIRSFDFLPQPFTINGVNIMCKVENFLSVFTLLLLILVFSPTEIKTQTTLNSSPRTIRFKVTLSPDAGKKIRIGAAFDFNDRQKRAGRDD